MLSKNQLSLSFRHFCVCLYSAGAGVGPGQSDTDSQTRFIGLNFDIVTTFL